MSSKLISLISCLALLLTACHSTKQSQGTQTVRDYYLQLPAHYFNGMPNTKADRVRAIQQEDLKSGFLKAHHFLECDQGGFQVTLRLSKGTGQKIFLAVGIPRGKVIYENVIPYGNGLSTLSINVSKPEIFEIANGRWLDRSNLLPDIDAQGVLEEYNKTAAPGRFRDQLKFICVNYEIIPSKNSIHVTWKENFETNAHELCIFIWDGTRFQKMITREEIQIGPIAK